MLTLNAPNKNCSRRHVNFLLLSFKENKAWCFKWILCLGFTWNIKPYFLWKTMKKYLWMSSAAVVIGTLRVNNCFNPEGMKRVDGKFTSGKSKKKWFCPIYNIFRIQRLVGKQCRSRWGGSLWATSSGSSLFASFSLCLPCNLKLRPDFSVRLNLGYAWFILIFHPSQYKFNSVDFSVWLK